MSYIKKYIEGSINIKMAILNSTTLMLSISEIVNLCVTAFQNGNRILIAGNGGSAADSQHIAAEFVSRFYFDRPGLPAIALSTDTSMLTAIGNDYGFDKIFSRQLQANGREGDVFIGISTSGRSVNVINAMKMARELKISTVGLAGGSGVIEEFSDICLCIPSLSTPFIQECHIMVGHIICGLVEEKIFPNHKPK